MTPQQNACLVAIRDLTVDGISPTFEEIGRRIGLASKSGVSRLIDALQEQGYVRRSAYTTNRCVEVIERHGGAISDARIASMSNEALESAGKRIADALAHRRALSCAHAGAAAQ